jgi:hypothetical protein
VAAIAGPAAQAAGIVARPEQLKFPSLTFTPPRADEYRVKLGNGMVAYLVPDRELPMVTINVLMRIGPDLDPAGKEGLANMTVALLTRSGTVNRTATQVEDRVAFLGAQLESGVGAGGGGFFGGGIPIGPAEARASVNLLSKDVDEGLGLLVDCLKTPAFQDDRLALRKDQALLNMKQRNDDSGQIEEREFGFLMRGDVFTEELIETFIDYKRKNEAEAVRLRPHPYEFALYYDI